MPSDPITLAQAAQELAPGNEARQRQIADSLKHAANRGTLEAYKVGGEGKRGVWLTTREAARKYANRHWWKEATHEADSSAA